MNPNIMGYVCESTDKLERAIHGSMSSGGKLVGGVGEDATDLEKLTEYDRLGGRITKEGKTVKNGAFYDFASKTPRKKPVITFVYSVNGRLVEVPEGDKTPLEVEAAVAVDKVKQEELQAKLAEKDAKKAAKLAAKGKKKKTADDEA